jgi:DNA end-binding protein Ku
LSTRRRANSANGSKSSGNPSKVHEEIKGFAKPAATNVVDLMEALRRSVGKEAAPAKAANPAKKPRKASSGQKEMLMPMEGKKPRDAASGRPQRKSA